jgi:hypothetical protein
MEPVEAHHAQSLLGLLPKLFSRPGVSPFDVESQLRDFGRKGRGNIRLRRNPPANCHHRVVDLDGNDPESTSVTLKFDVWTGHRPHEAGRIGAVDETFRSALAAGARAIADPVKRVWGGYSGYIVDPEGNRWEIAWAPGS